MNRSRSLSALLVLGAFLLFLSLASLPQFPTVTAQTGEPGTKIFIINVSQHGFNGSKSGMNITVNSGDLVELIFVWDPSQLELPLDLYPTLGQHTIEIPELGISTPLLSQNNQNATLIFTATTAGTLTIRCSAVTNQCFGHDNLQGGVIVVLDEEGTGGGASAPIVTLLNLNASPADLGYPFLVELSAELERSDGRAIPGMPVSFYRNTTLGWAKLGVALTDFDGVSSLNYTLKEWMFESSFRAVFDGFRSFEPSTSNTVEYEPLLYLGFGSSLKISEPIEAPFVSGQNYMVDLRLVGIEPSAGVILVSMLLVAVGSVWATYIFTVGQIYKISKTKETGEGWRAFRSSPSRKDNP